MELTLFNI